MTDKDIITTDHEESLAQAPEESALIQGVPDSVARRMLVSGEKGGSVA